MSDSLLIYWIEIQKPKVSCPENLIELQLTKPLSLSLYLKSGSKQINEES